MKSFSRIKIILQGEKHFKGERAGQAAVAVEEREQATGAHAALAEGRAMSGSLGKAVAGWPRCQNR